MCHTVQVPAPIMTLTHQEELEANIQKFSALVACQLSEDGHATFWKWPGEFGLSTFRLDKNISRGFNHISWDEHFIIN